MTARRSSDPIRDVQRRLPELPSTPQTQPVDERQVRNDSGGYSFEVDDLTRLKRFLTLGVDSGTANVAARDLAHDNAEVVFRLTQDDPFTLVDTVVDFSTSNRAPKQQPGLFALAVTASVMDNRDGRAYALAALPAVARTGSTLFEFIRYAQQFRGWGRGLRSAVRRWYVEKGVTGAAYQAVKYRQRAGWSHRDLLRLTHPKVDGDMNELFRWVTGRGTLTNGREFDRLVTEVNDPLAIVVTFERLQRTTTAQDVVRMIASTDSITWEMIPDRFINDPAVWEALIARGVPATALMRQLPRLTRIGVLSPMSSLTATVAAQLRDPERLRRGRVHPINVLLAQRTYAAGRSDRGSSTWAPVREIVDALDTAFYVAYDNVTPSGKRLMLSLDVSGTMRNPVLGSSLTCREAAAALSLVTAATEDRYVTNAFTGSLIPLGISSRQRLDDVLRLTSALPFGRTDCALPMLTALRFGTEIDTFVIYTDSETNQNSVHPHVALQRYRREVNPEARLVVVALTSTGFTIADPSDGGMLDLAGFDAALPDLVSGFARGEF